MRDDRSHVKHSLLTCLLCGRHLIIFLQMSNLFRELPVPMWAWREALYMWMGGRGMIGNWVEGFLEWLSSNSP